MLKNLLPYRQITFSLLLFAYLGSTFQAPLFEILHLLSHVTDFSNSSHSFHSFSSHDNGHQHLALITIKDLGTQEEEGIPLNNQKELKKKIDFNYNIEFVLPFENQVLIRPFQKNILFGIAFQDIPTPPPKYS